MNLICKSLSHSFLLQFIEKAEAREKERLKKEEREVSGSITFVLHLSSSYEYIPELCSSSTPPGWQEITEILCWAPWISQVQSTGLLRLKTLANGTLAKQNDQSPYWGRVRYYV